MVNTLIQPKLGLSRKTDADLLEYSSNIINAIDLNILSFPGVALAALKTKRAAYDTSLGKVKHGTPADTATKNNDRTELENGLRSMANDCAEIANGDEALFLLSGFQIRSKPTPSGMLEAPKSFELNLGPLEGTLEAKFKRVKNANAYEVFFGKYNTDPSTWELLKVTTSGKNMISDLESNVLFSARVRAVGTKGKKGEWSEIVTRKTY